MTGIYTEDNGIASLQFTNLPDANLENVLSVITQFIIASSDEGKKNFSDLYEILTHPSNHIGMKKGIIPIYIAVILHFFKKYAVITKNNREMEINARLLESINNNPADYDIYLEQWDSAKEQYITSLEQIFGAHIRVAEKEYNNFDYIVRAIQRWYLQLPKYVKEIKKVYMGDGNSASLDGTALRFLNSLRAPEINAREYLFGKLLWVFGVKEFDILIVNEIINIKNYIEGIKNELINHLIDDLKIVFGGKKIAEGATLSSIVTDWVDSLDAEVHSHVFSNSEKTLLAVCSNVTPDCERFVEDLARPATNLRIDDWGEITIDCFVQVIGDFVTTVNAYNEKTQQSMGTAITGSYKISYVDDAGIALDEDDVVAIASRNLIDNTDLFVKDRILDSKNKAISENNDMALTSIITYYECNKELLWLQIKDTKVIGVDGTTIRGRAKINEYIKHRPSDEVIAIFTQECKKFWEAIVDKCPEIKENNTTVGIYRNNNGGLIFFRPIALYPFAKASVRIKENYSKSYTQIIESIPQELLWIQNRLWKKIIWDDVAKKMVEYDAPN